MSYVIGAIIGIVIGLVAGIPLGLNLVVYPESQGYEKQASENAKLCFVSYLLALLVLPCTFAILTKLVGM